MKIIKVCHKCGCEKVRRVEYSDWDIDTQSWEPIVMCRDCMAERKTIDKPFETSGEVGSKEDAETSGRLAACYQMIRDRIADEESDDEI